MEWRADMPERSHVEVMVQQTRDAVFALNDVVIGDGKNPGLAETVRRNTDRIAKLESARSRGGETGMIFWAKVGALTTAIGGVMEIAKRLLGG